MLYDNITKLAAFGEVTVRPLEIAKAPLHLGVEAVKGAGRGAGLTAALGTAGGLGYGAVKGFKDTQGNLKQKLRGAVAKSISEGLHYGAEGGYGGAIGGAATGGLIGAAKTVKNTFSKGEKRASFDYENLKDKKKEESRRTSLGQKMHKGMGAGLTIGGIAGGLRGLNLSRGQNGIARTKAVLDNAASSGLVGAGIGAGVGAYRHAKEAVGDKLHSMYNKYKGSEKKASYEYATLEKIAEQEHNEGLSKAVNVGLGATAGSLAGGYLGRKHGGNIGGKLVGTLAARPMHKEIDKANALLARLSDDIPELEKKVRLQKAAVGNISTGMINTMRNNPDRVSQIANSNKFLASQSQHLDDLQKGLGQLQGLKDVAKQSKNTAYNKYLDRVVTGVKAGRAIGTGVGAVGGGLALGYGAKKAYDRFVSKNK
jgi:hypothetical protein